MTVTYHLTLYNFLWSLLCGMKMDVCYQQQKIVPGLSISVIYTDLCPCGETQTMFHSVESCPLTKLNGGLSRLHSADEDAISSLTSYGS